MPDSSSTKARHEPLLDVMAYQRQGGKHLTLGALRKLLDKNAGLPDDVPVFYQRIEDSYFTANEDNGWRVTLLPWESFAWSEEREQAYIENGYDYRVVMRDGKKYLMDLTEYIAAFGAYVAEDEYGNKAVCIHAHY